MKKRQGHHLTSYQKHALNLSIKKGSIALFLEMGIGKTAIVLFLISYHFRKSNISKVLLIAPKAVSTSYTWQAESALWGYTDDLLITSIHGTDKQKVEQLRQPAQIVIINPEALPFFVRNCEDLDAFDMLVLDESHLFKSHSSNRFKIIQSVLPQFKYRILLSGTPMPKDYLDLWAQIYILDDGKALHKRFSHYVNEYFHKSNARPWNKWLKDGASNLINNKIKHLTLTMLGKNYVDVPEIEYIDHIIIQNSQFKKDYKAFRKELITKDISSDLSQLDVGVLYNKLLQFCNGAVYDENKKVHVKHNLKLHALKEIINKHPNDNILLAYRFKFEKDLIKKHFKTAVDYKEKDSILNWNKGDIKLLIANMKSLSFGVNLQRGGHVIVWFSGAYEYANYHQFNARLHRKGQKNKVAIYRLQIEKGEDQRAFTVMDRKLSTQSNFKDFLNYYDI